MNYDAIIKRLNRVIDKAASRVHGSKVHIVNIDTDISNLAGLIVILAESPKPIVPNIP